ncbi:Uncharacterised protein [Yersinia enterocolitica]|uniref:hypothetical protein n=1 Tax=Yersinia mollaretii TaxID=33060 RepID=UPI0005E782A5|nr:hypothetical protein [Yersinia mollaretii]CNK97058.1 Uncharacterised protein [Yersinia enterocolitica]
MSIFGKNKISASDNLQQAMNKKANNSNISQKTINKINQKLNNLKTISEVNDARVGLIIFTDRSVRQQVMELISSNQNVNRIITTDNIRSIKNINKPLTPHKALIISSPERKIQTEYQRHDINNINPLQQLHIIDSPECKPAHTENKSNTIQGDLENYIDNIDKKQNHRRVTFSEQTIVSQIPSEDEAGLKPCKGGNLNNEFQPYNIKLTEKDIRGYLNIVHKMVLEKYSPRQIQNEMVYHMKLLPSLSRLDNTRTMYQSLAKEKSDKLLGNICQYDLLYRNPRTIRSEEINQINPDHPARKQTRRY